MAKIIIPKLKEVKTLHDPLLFERSGAAAAMEVYGINHKSKDTAVIELL